MINSRGQHERTNGRCPEHLARRTSLTSRARVRARLAHPLLHRTRHVEKRAYVQTERQEGQRCWSGERKGDGQQGERAKEMRQLECGNHEIRFIATRSQSASRSHVHADLPDYICA